MHVALSGYPMERIAVDIMGELPITERGDEYVLVTDEALIAETAVWPNFFLMNVFFALKRSKLFIIICCCCLFHELDYVLFNAIQCNNSCEVTG